MSFKRDGDDLSLLNKLKSQRVAELLGSYIPQDEVKVLSNGRLTCVICSYGPIFDTMAVLSKHRTGQKHILELSKFIRRQEEIQFEHDKKLQLESLRQKSLGEKTNSNKYDSLCSPRLKKKIIEIPNLNCDSIQDPSLSRKPAQKFQSCQLEKYLEGLPKKPSLGQYLEEGMVQFAKSVLNYERETSKPTSGAAFENKETDLDFSRHLSGWIKNKDGTWMKDPNAEFDTDDEEPTDNMESK